jgi:hypothetical protein
MRRDGSIITKEGYDPATQLWYKSSGGITLPPIPDLPSWEDAQRALKKLDGLLDGFSFEDGISRSAALAGLMTPVLRAAMDIAPMFLITAPEPRTGKTKLVYLCAVLATGHNPIATAGSEKPEEMEKRIETAARYGRPILHFNNLPNGMVLESAGLCQMLTEGTVNVRKLGVHEEAVCDCRATTAFANGNNITLADDLVVRAVSSRLNAQSEHPEDRTFEFDPIERVRAERGEYLAAVFTIVKAFKAAGGRKPEGAKVIAGFEEWSRLVQQPLMWLGRPDPLGNWETMRGLDEKEQDLDRLLDVLKKYRRELGQSFTVAKCVQLASEKEKGEWGDYRRPDLRELISRDGKLNERAFGKLLSRHRDRLRGGWQIVFVRIEHNHPVYRLLGPGDAKNGELRFDDAQ